MTELTILEIRKLIQKCLGRDIDWGILGGTQVSKNEVETAMRKREDYKEKPRKKQLRLKKKRRKNGKNELKQRKTGLLWSLPAKSQHNYKVLGKKKLYCNGVNGTCKGTCPKSQPSEWT